MTGQTDVRPLFRTWLNELRADGLQLSAQRGDGANHNLWCLSLPSSDPVTAPEVVEFLRAAMAIRAELVALQSVRPASFYAWYDKMAGELRLSTACCTKSTLPFGATLVLLDDPNEIAEAFAQSSYRDGIPWSELRDEPLDATADHLSVLDAVDLRVWAVEWL